MQRCLELAQLGAGFTAPNPMVGCVIVNEGRIIGEGYTSPYGGSHAEVNAINAVEDQQLLQQSILYVNLEPCAHFGQTPPCCDLIVERKIPQVVIACVDPFAKVNGAGIKRMMENGIDVKVGLLEADAVEFNRRFFTFHEKKRPYIILKWAETADGFVDHNRTSAETSPLIISGNVANTLVHKWRSHEAAILVGKNTVQLDNPSLTVRHTEGPNPIRVILDQNIGSSPSSHVFDNRHKTLVFNKLKNGKNDITEFIQVKDIFDLSEVLSELYKRNILSVLVEGGPTIHNSFFMAGLWDEIRQFRSNNSIGEGIRALSVTRNSEQRLKIGTDLLSIFRNR